jgi:hypothetical protein
MPLTEEKNLGWKEGSRGIYVNEKYWGRGICFLGFFPFFFFLLFSDDPPKFDGEKKNDWI